MKSKISGFRNGKFKILQFTDLHFGEDNDSDLLTLQLIGSATGVETPNLVVITGEICSCAFSNGNGGYFE